MRFVTVLIFALTIAFNSQADDRIIINDLYKKYSGELYLDVVEDVASLRTNSTKLKSFLYYIQGLSFNRLQEYEKAVSSFKTSIRHGNKKKDLHYELAQSYYAMNEVEQSKKYFIKSYKSGFKKTVSLYYIAHISQMMGDMDLAKKYYTRILKNKKADKNMLQVASFQLAEVILSHFQNSHYIIDELIRKYVFPLMDDAIETDPKSVVANEIRNRKLSITKQYKLNFHRALNGRIISKRELSGSVSLDTQYDDNVTLVSDNPNDTSDVKHSSLILSSAANLKYSYLYRRRFLISPQINFDYMKHSSGESEVYQNDEYSYSFKLDNTYEHVALNRPASLIFNFGYDYKAKDWNADKSIQFYGEKYSYEIGERFWYFSAGETRATVGHRVFVGHNSDMDYNATNFNLSQTALLAKRHFLTFTFSYEKASSGNESNEYTMIFGRADYLLPNVIKRYDFGVGASSAMLDTSARGGETLSTASMSLTRNFGSHFKAKLDYEYTNNSSDTEENAYNKQVYGLNLQYQF